MQKAYIVLSHTNPQQLYRLLQRLDDGAASFFIHIDKKRAIADFNSLADFGTKVKMVKRVTTNWAEFGLVEATLNALKEIKDSDKNFDRITLLSGQDYPIKSNDFIDQFFADSRYSIFLQYFTIPDHIRWKTSGGLYRINKYFFGLKAHERFLAKSLNFLGMIFPFLQRKFPEDLTAYAGSQWWTIDMNALHYILDFVAANPRYYFFHKYTFASDELFFHSILLNSKEDELRKSILNDNMMFMNWEDPGNAHPEILLKKDLPKLTASPALFARKFDARMDVEIFDLVDEKCLRSKDEVVRYQESI